MTDIRFMHHGGAQEHGVYRTLDSAVEAAQRAVEATRGVVFWSPAMRPSDGQQTRSVVALRVPSEGIYTFKDTHEVLTWWRNLPSGVREALEAAPAKVLAADELVAVTNTRPYGPRAASVAWVDTGDAEEGRYRLLTDLQHFAAAMAP
ncbi:hypothetical protein [Brachybacterium tyrofermentans]|uniref:hypothetical protein n=1 Tax=Brachybacterium tyrofermentans TaxID=47848 RepID=UPI003F937CD5